MMSNLSFFSNDLKQQINKYALPKKYHCGDAIVSSDFYKNRTGFIENGIFKVNFDQEDNSTLLYYLSDKHDVVISFMNVYTNTPMQIKVTALKCGNLLWVPNQVITELSKKFPILKNIVINSYIKNNQYLLLTIKNITTSLSDRLHDYLLNRAVFHKDEELNLNRREIAFDLNVSLESISRSLGKLEQMKKITRKSKSIIITDHKKNLLVVNFIILKPNNMNELDDLPFNEELISLIKQDCVINNYKKGDRITYEKELLGYSTYLVKGILELYVKYENRRIFLYNLYGNEICLVSFSGLFDDFHVDFYDKVIEDSTTITIPIDKLTEWSILYEEFRELIMSSYQKHYSSLLDVIRQFTEDSLETRLYNYLKLKSQYLNSLKIPISHKQIACDLSFTRESITRGLKKIGRAKQIKT